MREPVAVLGAVLAGGRSTRFGRDKALTELDGERLLDRAVRALDGVADPVVVVSSHEVHDTPGRLRLPDLRPGLGPLAGIETALDHAERSGAPVVLVLACDLPGVHPELLNALLGGLGRHRAVALAREGAPGFEPLCAVYRTECLATASGLLDADLLGAHRLLDAVGGAVLARPGGPWANVNTPKDLEAWERGRSPGGLAGAGGAG